jgi:hypothetical protein
LRQVWPEKTLQPALRLPRERDELHALALAGGERFRQRIAEPHLALDGDVRSGELASVGSASAVLLRYVRMYMYSPPWTHG